jgi:signal transduction histidine kinase
MHHSPLPRYHYWLYALLITLSFVTQTARASSLGEHHRVPLAEGWQYRWGDSPFKDGVPEWTQDSAPLDWLQIQYPSDPPFRDGQNNVWYRYRLPEGKLPGNSLYITSVDLIVEVYLEGERIYHYGEFAADGTGSFAGWPWHLIDLPHGSEGKYLYFRIYSDYSDIGLAGEIMLGSEYAHIQHIVRSNLAPVSVGLILLACGVIMLLSNIRCWRGPVFMMGLFFINLGLTPIQESQIKQLLFFEPKFWQFFMAISYFCLPITMAAFVHSLYGKGIWSLHKIVWMAHTVFLVVAISLSTAGIVNLSSFYVYFDVLAFFTLFLLATALTAKARSSDSNQKILTTGFWLLYAAMLYNGLAAHGIIPFAPRFEYLGPLLLGICFLVILIRHYTRLNQKIKHRSQKLEELNASLEQIVEERTNTLKQLNRSKDQFFAIIAHDLKSSISAQLFLLQDYEQTRTGVPPQDVPELRRNCQKTYNLLTRLLTWARGQQGQLNTNKETLAARGLVEGVLSTLRAQAAAKHIELRCIPHDEPLIHADADMISTALRNLIANAIKFTPPGGWVTVKIRLEDEQTRFTITDNGIGLPDAIIEGLFLPKSYEAISTDTEGTKGSGLGLLLCKEFIDAHQGEITASAPDAGGAQFSFTLPTR